jgi:hypothetical protein
VSKRILLRMMMSLALALTTLVLSAQANSDTKLSPAEVVTKHLESIGSAETRARVHGTRIKGACTLMVREGGTGQAQGNVILASQGDMNLIKMVFQSEENPTWVKFDGSKASVSQFRPGRRTSLENFFSAYEVLVKEGLLGGTLSEAWPLLNIQTRNPKLEYAGIKEVGGRRLMALKYSPRKGSEVKITVFFETETFRHVRTEYSQTIYATDQQRIGSGRGLPSPTEQRATNARISAFEEFSDFKEEQGLLLPHTYKFELSIQSDIRPALINWTIDLSEFQFSSPFDPAEVGSVPKWLDYTTPRHLGYDQTEVEVS